MKLLEKHNYNNALKIIKSTSINTLFAEAVIEKKIQGKIYVDNLNNPKTFYIIHPYGMTLLLGNSGNIDFNNQFKEYALNLNNTRKKQEWMQAIPESWNIVLPELFGDKLIKSSDNTELQLTNIVELNTRVNFKFSFQKFIDLRKPILDNDIKIVRTDSQAFREMPGSVIPAFFWDTEDDFLNNGVGYSLYYKNKLASTAYSSCINDTQLELGIETLPEFRNKGFAQFVCQSLIDYCIKNNFEPVWACRLENLGSYKLAQKLGFTPTKELPYYRLSK